MIYKFRLVLLVFIVLLSIFVYIGYKNSVEEKSLPPGHTGTAGESEGLVPVSSVTHPHGLALDVLDSKKLYIATHQGLLVLINDQELFRIGDVKDDFMGFSQHPSNSDIFYTSGHPQFGGNLGVQKSEDGGISWKKLSDGINGPVDFHTMAVSAVNPEILYGLYMNSLQRSTDGGVSWNIVSPNLPPTVQIVTDTNDEQTVYAATTKGLLVSRTQGETWESLSSELENNVVASLAVDQNNSQDMISFSENLGLAKSTDGGITWESIGVDFGNESILFLAISKQDSKIIYGMSQTNSLYKSSDGGVSWEKIL